VTHIRALTRDDIPLGLRLSRQAGWNQLDQDWLRLLDLDALGCFAAERDGTPVATLTCTRYGPVAWIAMMLVDQNCRRQGIGRALMAHGLQWLDGQGIETVRLDATPLGQPLYESLGFVPEYALTRFGGRPIETPRSAAILPGDPRHRTALLEFDEQISGFDRGRLVERLIAEQPDSLQIRAGAGDALDGYALSRPGHHAIQVGPCLARPESGSALLADVLSRHHGEPVFVDIPDGHEASRELAERCGLTPLRPLLRMCRGQPVAERTEQIWAIAGPDLG
jgi:GNAT superfamily N-acetyltransferase